MSFRRSAWRYAAPVTTLFRRKSVLELRRQPRRSTPRHYLAISTMVRDEGHYLAEWLAFHRLVGVDHIYIYDNESSDDSATVLAPFVQSGFVTVIPWSGQTPAQGLQLRAYHHVLSTYGQLYHWLALIDVDEFLFPVNGDNLPAALSRFERLPAVAVPWTMFGTSGHKTRPSGLVIEAYTMRAPGFSRPKSIVQPCEVRGVSNAHLLNYDEGRMVGYNERGELVGKRGPFYSDVLRLNHYYTRSEEELARKRARSITRWQGDGTRVDMHVSSTECAPQRDTSSARFAPGVRAALDPIERDVPKPLGGDALAKRVGSLG